MIRKIAFISMVFGIIIAGFVGTEIIRANTISCLRAGANFDLSRISSKGCEESVTTSSRASSHISSSQPTLAKTSAYYALGDSVAAGLGLPAGTETSAQDRQCGRSSSAYGSAVANAAGLPYYNLACSGATAGDLLTDQHIAGPNPEQQLGEAFSAGTPKLITITAGANDIQWANFIKLCVTTNCNTTTNTRIVSAATEVARLKLSAAMEYVYLKSNGNPPRVVLTGYYNPLSLACVQQTSGAVTAYEIAWINTSVNNLNAMIQSVASKYSFASYAPVNFTGHDICSADPWVQGLDASAPLHPTATGQQVIARSIIRQL